MTAVISIRETTTMANQTAKKTKEVTDAYIEAMKNTTRASVFFQLVRKPEMTATEIAKALDEDVDVVYYHMKSLKKLGIISEPRVEVRENYLEKYYSLSPEIKKRFAEVDREANKKLGEMPPEEFRQMLLTACALVKSIVIGSANQIENADVGVIDSLIKQKNFAIGFLYCTKERYSALLDDLRKITKPTNEDTVPLERDYVMAFLAIPKLDVE